MGLWCKKRSKEFFDAIYFNEFVLMIGRRIIGLVDVITGKL